MGVGDNNIFLGIDVSSSKVGVFLYSCTSQNLFHERIKVIWALCHFYNSKY